MLDNGNIKEKHQRKRGLHLNAEDNGILANNFLSAIRNEERRSLDSNLVCNEIIFTDENLFSDNNADLSSLTLLQ